MQLPSATTPATPARRPGDAAIAAGVLLALVLIVLPSTPILLDLLLAANLLISTLLLLLVLPLSGPLELPSFPSLLLLTGLFRLGLAIAAARLILGVGTGGAMIEVLGSLVSGGAWVAGVGVFVVLAIVQIAVIAAGASRAAEVAARFSLDALPGKQFGIDAALSAKAIDGAAAEDQRGRLQAEADFYGAMDGAAKFARGEAVASVAIVALTFVAGAGQAVANAGLSAWQTAVNTYGVLVAGEAATILLPGLMTCYAAALMVTKGAAGRGVARDLAAGTRGNVGALWTASALLAILAFVARPPSVPLLIAAGASAAWALWSRRRPPLSEIAAETPEAAAAYAEGVTIRLGLGLLGLLGSGPEGDLFQRARDVKRRIGEQLRVPLPPLTVTDDPSLPVSTYVISCQGQEAARGRLMMSRALVTADGDAPLPDGVPAERPTGENAVWVERDALPLSGQRGWRVQTPCEVLLADLQRALRQRVTAFVGRDAAHEFVERVRAQRPVLVSELEQAGVGLGAVRQVMTGLAEEGVPLSDPAAILEAVADAAPEAKHPTQLIEAARRAVAPSITRACASADGVIKVVALGRNVERYVLESLEAAEPGRPVTLPPRVVRSLRDEIARLRARCLLCTPEARRSVWESLRDFVPELKVVVPDELVGSARVRVLGEADCPADIVYEAQRAAAGAHTVGSESH